MEKDKAQQIISIKVGTVTVTAINDFDEPAIVADHLPTVSAEELACYKEIYPSHFAKEGLDPWTYFCYVIEDGDMKILVDAGVGQTDYAPNWNGKLIERMGEIGIHPQDIDIVVLTHLHPDHVGWATTLENGKHRKTFPKARYIAHKLDYQAISTPGGALYGFMDGCFESSLLPLSEDGSLALLNGESVRLSNHVMLFHKPGHTPGLMCAVITSGEETCVLTSDIIANPIQVTNPNHNFIYDIDKEAAIKSRTSVLEAYIRDGVYLGASHPGIGRIVYQNGRRIWKIIET